ncbi:hypothetical protein ABIE67_009610 [Streptomyces sp. V4I8]|uniref:hypothetical protein n=1 Tax=Streptomyces sp. V4I8 TaxID=3156469 RepID=UPI00351208B9
MAEYIGEMKSGTTLMVGDTLRSPNGIYALTMQADGNLVMYSGPTAVWATHTWNVPDSLRPVRAAMQDDGNFVLHSAVSPMWDTHTGGHPGARLCMQDDRNLVIYTDANEALWASHTTVPPATGSQPVTSYREEVIAFGMLEKCEATLYRDGLLVVKSTNQNRSASRGMHCHILVVIQDGSGRALMVSNEFIDDTRGSIFDFTCNSDGVTVHQQRFAEIVGRLATSVDIYLQNDGGFVDLRNEIIRVLKETGHVVEEMAAQYVQLA